MKKPLIVIAGPTACGKTDIAVMLAKKINGEIISADSMQIYKFMDIGTAKIKKDEMQGIKHYLIDELNPDEEFNAMIFQQKAKKYIEEIHNKGKTPILVGGTGFYINALVYDNNFMLTDEDDGIRKTLYEEAEIYGKEYVYKKLEAVDPEYASEIHFNNIKRVIRALEYFLQTGEKMSLHNSKSKKKSSPYDLKFIILNMDRQKLYERINLRVNLMLEKGLLDEIKNLLDMGYSSGLVSMQGLGYKEFMPYLEGKSSFENAVETLKQKTRNFAKRQLTWFKGQNLGFWLDVTNKTKEEAVWEILNYIGADND